MAITTEADAENKGTEMGRKYIVPYGLYRVEGYVSANLARKTTGFSDDDLELLWTAILNMFENDHSAARGKMAVRDLIVFKHDTELGCAPAHKLFDLVKAARREGVATPRSYEDYTVTVAEDRLPRRRDLHADGVIYAEEDFLQLSGLQHFKFCRRQWALIHVENQWAENLRHHRRCHPPRKRPQRRLHRKPGRPPHHPGYAASSPARWGFPAPAMCWNSTAARPAFPSKAGTASGSPTRWNTSGDGRRRPRWTPSSCAGRPCVWRRCSAVKFREGALYYGEPRRRTEVVFTPELRQEVRDAHLPRCTTSTAAATRRG